MMTHFCTFNGTYYIVPTIPIVSILSFRLLSQYGVLQILFCIVTNLQVWILFTFKQKDRRVLKR